MAANLLLQFIQAGPSYFMIRCALKPTILNSFQYSASLGDLGPRLEAFLGRSGIRSRRTVSQRRMQYFFPMSVSLYSIHIVAAVSHRYRVSCSHRTCFTVS